MSRFRTPFLAILIVAALLAAAAAQPVIGLMDKDRLAAAVDAGKARLRADPRDAAAAKALGIAHHNLAALKVAGAADDAVAALTKAVDLAPDDAEALAYLGSAHTMTARDSWNPATKLSAVNTGIALMDKAVRRDADNLGLRLLRANNALGLPGMFGRRPVAREDFAFVVARLEANGRGDPALLSEIYGKLAALCSEEGDAAGRAAYLTKAKEAAR